MAAITYQPAVRVAIRASDLLKKKMTTMSHGPGADRPLPRSLGSDLGAPHPGHRAARSGRGGPDDGRNGRRR